MATTDYCEELAALAGLYDATSDDERRPTARETKEHLLCFAKHHYGTYSAPLRIEAMRHMLSQVLGLEYDGIRKRDLIHLLVRACEHYSQYTKNRPVSDLIIELAERTSLSQLVSTYKDAVPLDDFFPILLGYLGNIPVLDGDRVLFACPRVDPKIKAYVDEKMTARIAELEEYERQQIEAQAKSFTLAS